MQLVSGIPSRVTAVMPCRSNPSVFRFCACRANLEFIFLSHAVLVTQSNPAAVSAGRSALSLARSLSLPASWVIKAHEKQSPQRILYSGL